MTFITLCSCERSVVKVTFDDHDDCAKERESQVVALVRTRIYEFSRKSYRVVFTMSLETLRDDDDDARKSRPAFAATIYEFRNDRTEIRFEYGFGKMFTAPSNYLILHDHFTIFFNVVSGKARLSRYPRVISHLSRIRSRRRDQIARILLCTSNIYIFYVLFCILHVNVIYLIFPNHFARRLQNRQSERYKQ